MKRCAPLLLLVLAGCGGQPVKYIVTPTSEPLCKAVAITCVSKDDVLTEGTSQSIEGNNLGISKVCKRLVACAPPKPTS